MPLVVRVADRVREVGSGGLVDRIVVATDSTEVAEVVARGGHEACLTDPGHPSGTDRTAEVALRPEFAEYDLIVNVQGDEPFLSRAALAGAIGRVRAGDQVGTAAAPLDPAGAADPDRVKVVMDAEGRALYFSRAPIPHVRDPHQAAGYWQHIGIYSFGREALARWTALAPTPLERTEGLEQLRALEHGMTIGVARLTEPAAAGIDTSADLALAESHWHQTIGGVR